jgi:polysaccharide biosynthesis/export protein
MKIARLAPDYTLLAAVLLLLIASACRGPFERTGPRFDPRKATAGPLTNLTALETANRLSPELLEPSPDPFTLGPGDVMELEIIGEPATRSLVTVGPDGKIYFFVLPGIDVWGLTLSQTRELLERELVKYMAAPQISVTLRGIQSKRVWLLGRLQNSGIYPIGAPMTLLESISAAGGLLSGIGTGPQALQDVADLRQSFVVRQGELIPVDFHRLIREGDMSQNIYLQPDDFVYLPSAVANDVYVLGAVRLPQPILFQETMTLVTAIAATGGTVPDAYLTQVAIVRGSMSQPQIAVINYKDIVHGRAQDVRLEPRDIVYVPFHPYRNVFKYLDLVLATFARAVAINEGARAGARQVVPVGVIIPIGGAPISGVPIGGVR